MHVYVENMVRGRKKLNLNSERKMEKRRKNGTTHFHVVL